MQVTIAAGLAGAFLLGRGRREGLALMEHTPDGAWRSFVAALFCLPAFLAVRFFSWASLGAPPGGMGRALTAELIGYTIAWVGFALVSLPLVSQWGRAARWPRFIAAWNWCNVVQYIMLLALSVPGALGVPETLSDLLTLIGLGYAIWLEWFVAREALGVDRLRAGVLVMADLVLGLFLGGLIQTLARG